MLQKHLASTPRQHRWQFRLSSSGLVGTRDEGKVGGTLGAVADGGSNEHFPTMVDTSSYCIGDLSI
jgi:hypothetical protein